MSTHSSPVEHRHKHIENLRSAQTAPAAVADVVATAPPDAHEQPPPPTAVRDPNLPSYYASLDTPSLLTRFQNLDNREVFLEYYSTLFTTNARNFVIDFGSKDAWVGLNVGLTDPNEMGAILANKRPPNLGSRWINIWAPHLQKGVIDKLAYKYRLSPRLRNLICSKPVYRQAARQETTPPPEDTPAQTTSFFGRKKTSAAPKTDPEKAAYTASTASIASKTEAINHFFIASDIWHYMSVDYGNHYACIGYNTLHNVLNTSSEHDVEEVTTSDTPEGKRVWCWLILCADDTVISIYEDPFADRNSTLMSDSDRAQLRRVRRNLLNVFQELSQAENAAKNTNPIMTLHLRRSQIQSALSLSQPVTEDPSLVLYYLFDDWYNSFNLLVGSENMYRVALERVRSFIATVPEPSHIDSLHHIGRQLQILKRLYESYLAIVDRVLETHKRKGKQENVLQRMISGQSEVVSETSDDQYGETGIRARSFGPVLAPEAVTRFERLRDRIELYALREIQACLDEKESLVFMTFNMIALKESQAVEKLTRGTILLTKVTIPFLPLSLLTAYFSMQIGNLQNLYSLKTYWVAFAVIAVLMFGVLLIYSMMTGTLEGKVIYRSLFRAAKHGVQDRRKRVKQS